MDFMKHVTEYQYNKFEEVKEAYYNLLEKLEDKVDKVEIDKQMNVINKLKNLNVTMLQFINEIDLLTKHILEDSIDLTEEDKRKLEEIEYLEKMKEKFIPMLLMYSIMNK